MQRLVGQWRLLIIIVLLAFLSGQLVFRLFEKQVLEHGEFVAAAKEQSTSSATLPASRGRIFASDRMGKLYPLAMSQWQYQLSISPRQVRNKPNLLAQLKKDLPQINTDELFAKINNDKVYVPPLVKGIDEQTARKIMGENLAGVYLQPTLNRIYPEGQTLAPQLVGFVGDDGSGKYGIESTHNGELTGQSGAKRRQQDSLGRLIDIIGSQQPTDGHDVVLTIDYNLQYEVETKLKDALQRYQADTGSIIIMDPNNGAILALASQPNFDPNTYRQVKAGDQHVFLSGAASDAYEPGSVIKPITMAAAIDAGLLQPETTNTFGPVATVDGHDIHNAKDNAFGKEDMNQVLENSDNVAMTWVSSLLGKEKERDYFAKFGFGAKTGVDLTGETAGYLAPLKNWNDLLRSTAAFGQGMSVNLVQLAQAYAVVANGGQRVTPHLVAKTVVNGQEKATDHPLGDRVISSETAGKVRQMLVDVVVKGHGKRAAIHGLSVGGKTGTAQIIDPTTGNYYEDRHIGTFAGLFPTDNAKFVMVIRLDNPKAVAFAESSAAPTFGEIGEWMANYYQLR